MLKYQADVFQEEWILPFNTQWTTIFLSRLRKPIDEEFLRDFLILDRKQNDIQATKPILIKSVLKTACLLLPNEILFKIFGYLDIQEI